MVFTMHVLTGVAAILSPFTLTNKISMVFTVIAGLKGIAGIFLGFTLF